MKYFKDGKEILLKKTKHKRKLPANIREVFTLVPLKTAPKGWFSLGTRAHLKQ